MKLSEETMDRLIANAVREHVDHDSPNKISVMRCCVCHGRSREYEWHRNVMGGLRVEHADDCEIAPVYDAVLRRQLASHLQKMDTMESR